MLRLLIATDGSDDARAAQEFAASLPFPERPDVRLLAVTPCPVNLSEYAVVSVPYEQARHIQRTVVAPRVAEEAALLRPLVGSVTTELRIGDPANEVIAAANDPPTDLIVMGASGLSAFSTFLLGSVSDDVCRSTAHSVLVVRKTARKSTTDGQKPIPTPSRVLFAADGSEASNQAIDRLASWSWTADARALVVTAHHMIKVFGVSVYPDEATRAAEQSKADAIQQSAVGKLGKTFSHVHTSICDTDQIARSIVDEAESWKADLIVLGNRGLSGWKRFMLGSTTLGVIRHAPCSVWVERLNRAT